MQIRPNRPSGCKICLSPNVDAVNQALGNGLGLKEIVSMFGDVYSRSSIYRHSLHTTIVKAQPVVESTNRARSLRDRVEKLLLSAEQRGDVKTCSTLIAQLMNLDARILDASPIRTAPPKIAIEYVAADGSAYDSSTYVGTILSADGWEKVLEQVLRRMAEHVEMKKVSPALQDAAEKFLDALIADKKERETKENVIPTENAAVVSDGAVSERRGGTDSGGGISDGNATPDAD